MRQYILNIDTVGVCNLSCPSCPQGNSAQTMPKGLLTMERLQAILDKATREASILDISLFNWTEPLLNPNLPTFIRQVRGKKINCHISTNLNRTQGIREMMAAVPTTVAVSVSGFLQENYTHTHRGGDIEVVKENMRLVAAHRRPGTELSVNWHKYRHNDEDRQKMTKFAERLGFSMHPVTAYLMPLEKVLARWAGAPADPVEELMLKSPLDYKQAAYDTRAHKCGLQLRQITMDHLANVQLCCAVYDPSKFTLCNFLDTPIATIQRMKDSHSFCGTCTSKGGHSYALMQTAKKPNAAVDWAMVQYVSWGHRVFPYKLAKQVRDYFKQEKLS